MAEDRADIAIETTEAIASLIRSELAERSGTKAIDAAIDAGLDRALSIIRTFAAALRIQQAPKRGRPRNQKAET